MFFTYFVKVLYEISSTVCIHVSSKELNDFGVLKRDKEEKQDDQKRRRRRGKIQFKVEETKEVMAYVLYLCLSINTWL